jgi:hypothetical protein
VENRVRLTGKGTRPLLMHSAQAASPNNKFAKQMKTFSSKRIKTDEDRDAMAHIDWEAALYWDEEVGPYIPGENIFACLLAGARITKNGKKIERGLSIETFRAALFYSGPRDKESLWGDGDSAFVDYRTVRIGQQRIERCRPWFSKWEFTADFTLDYSIMELEEFERISADAGRFEGLGDFRRLYGRFDAKVEQLD